MLAGMLLIQHQAFTFNNTDLSTGHLGINIYEIMMKMYKIASNENKCHV